MSVLCSYKPEHANTRAVVGFILIIMGIGAYFSGETSSQTSEGRMGIGVVILLGLAAIYGGVSARAKDAEKQQAAAQVPQMSVQTIEIPPPPPDIISTVYCSTCGRAIQSDFRVCPFCGKPTKASCPKCGKQIEQEYVACPFCGTPLKND